MKKQILLYNIKDKKRELDIRKVLMPLRIPIKMIPNEDFSHPLGYLIGLEESKPSEQSANDYQFDDEMMVMAGFTGYDIDQVIRGFHKRRIATIPLKAILTPHNQDWNSYKLYENLKEEHEKMSKETNS